MRRLDPPNWHLIESKAELDAKIAAARMSDEDRDDLLHWTLKAAIARKMAFRRVSSEAFSRTALLAHKCSQTALERCHQAMKELD